MSTKKKLPLLDYGLMIEYMIETNSVKRFLATIGEEEFLANLAPEQREKLRRLLQKEHTPARKPKKG